MAHDGGVADGAYRELLAAWKARLVEASYSVSAEEEDEWLEKLSDAWDVLSDAEVEALRREGNGMP